MRQLSVSLTIAIASTLLCSWTALGQLERGTAGVHAASTPDVTVTGDRSTADNTYYFTLSLPERAEGFTRVSFTEQSRPAVTPIPFDLDLTQAFVGTPEAISSAIPLEGTWIDETGTIWVGFNSPISPGATVTIAFQAQAQSANGSYEYGIAAYPNATPPVPVYVGNGQLTISQ